MQYWDCDVYQKLLKSTKNLQKTNRISNTNPNPKSPTLNPIGFRVGDLVGDLINYYRVFDKFSVSVVFGNY